MLTSQPTWFHMDPERWAREEEHVKDRFPHFEWGERAYPSPCRYWRGYLQPLPNPTTTELIAAHLAHAAPIHVGPTGALEPTRHDLRPSLDLSTADLTQRFLIEVVYLEPPAVPRIYALRPRIDDRSFPLHPHLNRGPDRPHPAFSRGKIGIMPSSDLCTFAPQDDIWSWDTSTAAQLLVWTSFWLAAHVIWNATGRERWLLLGAPHDPHGVLRDIHPDAPCNCGSGKKFKECCITKMQVLADRLDRTRTS